MVNLWFDHRLSGPWIVTGGVGLGAAYINYESVSAVTTASFLDDGDLVFAYQGGFAIGYEIIPNWVASVDYRYFATTDPQLTSSAGAWETEYKGHDLMLGLRLFF